MKTCATSCAFPFLLLPLLAGCPPRRPPTPPPPHVADDQPLPVVMARVNDNTAAMDFVLRGTSVRARGEWEGDRFELTGTLLHRQPRDLFLRLQHTLAGGMDIGSNQTEFWVWSRLRDPQYWWGEHARIDEHAIVPIPIRPDHLLDVLGLIELPPPVGPDAPLFWVSPRRYELIFTEEGRRVITKVIDIDRQPPYLVREMIYFHPSGRPFMSAELSDYAPIDGTTVQVPRQIDMRWLQQGSWLELRIGRMERFDAPEAAQRFISPLVQGLEVGTVERVDGAPPALPAAMQLPAEGLQAAPSATQPAGVVSP